MNFIQRHITFLITAFFISIFINQTVLQYYLSQVSNYAMFSHWLYPNEQVSATMEFFRNPQLYADAGENILIATGLGLFLSYVIIIAVHRKLFGSHLESDRHGSAKFATIKEIQQTNLLQDPKTLDKVEKRHGLIVGAIEHSSGIPIQRYDTHEKLTLRQLMHFGHQHTLLIAPTGGGKGVGIVTPNLLNYPDSVVMYDMKGKDWETTAGHRANNLKNVCIKFEPTNGDGSSCRYNPMEFIKVGTPEEVSQAGNLALMLIDGDGKGFDGNHFKENGAKLLGAIILHVLYTKKAKNLASVAAMLSGIDPDTGTAYKDGVKGWLGEMCGQKKGLSHLLHYKDSHNISEEEAKKRLALLVDDTGYNRNVKQISSSLYFNNGEKEVAGIISSANTPLTLFNDPIIAQNTSESTINLSDFQSGDKPVSLYIVVMANDQERIRPLTRILITQIISVVQSSEHGKLRELLFLLDEFATLKKMPVVANALATIRSFKARFMLVVQDLSQLDEYYDKLASSIIANCGVRIGYPSNDLVTNEKLAKWTGDTTYIAETTSTAISKQQGFGIGASSTTTTSKQESQRTLLTANEIATMGTKTLIFREGKNAIFGTSYNYREDKRVEKFLNLKIPTMKYGS